MNGKNPCIHELIDYEQFCGMRAVEEKPVKEIGARELYEWQVKGKKIQSDRCQGTMRNIKLCEIGGDLIPLATVMDHADQIPRDIDVVVYCKSGVQEPESNPRTGGKIWLMKTYLI